MAEDTDEGQSGVVKIGMFLSEYLEGVPNSKIFTLSQALYDSMSSEFKEVLDDESTSIQELDKDGVQQLHQSLAKKDYTQVREIIKGSVSFVGGESAPPPQDEGEVLEDILKTMKKDPDHEFLSGETVAVKRSDGRITYATIFMLIGDRAVLVIKEGNDYLKKGQKLSDLWHF